MKYGVICGLTLYAVNIYSIKTLMFLITIYLESIQLLIKSLEFYEKTIFGTV